MEGVPPHPTLNSSIFFNNNSSNFLYLKIITLKCKISSRLYSNSFVPVGSAVLEECGICSLGATGRIETLRAGSCGFQPSCLRLIVQIWGSSSHNLSPSSRFPAVINCIPLNQEPETLLSPKLLDSSILSQLRKSNTICIGVSKATRAAINA